MGGANILFFVFLVFILLSVTRNKMKRKKKKKRLIGCSRDKFIYMQERQKKDEARESAKRQSIRQKGKKNVFQWSLFVGKEKTPPLKDPQWPRGRRCPRAAPS